jgi:hypothetical protein
VNSVVPKYYAEKGWTTKYCPTEWDANFPEPNLADLAKLSAEDPAEVRRYIGLAEDRLAELGPFLGRSTATKDHAC